MEIGAMCVCICVCESIERTKIATCIVYRYGKSAQNTIRLRFNCPNRAVTAGREQLAGSRQQAEPQEREWEGRWKGSADCVRGHGNIREQAGMSCSLSSVLGTVH